MKTDIGKLWVKALRSGKYKQGHMRLRDGDNFCCLGVLCDIYAKQHDVKWAGDRHFGFQFLNGQCLLPMEVVDWAGFEDTSPSANGKALTALNDSGQWTFDEIADLIDANMEAVR